MLLTGCGQPAAPADKKDAGEAASSAAPASAADSKQEEPKVAVYKIGLNNFGKGAYPLDVLENSGYKLLLGAPTVALLQNGLVLSGISGDLYEAVEGVILLLVVFITVYLNTEAVTKPVNDKSLKDSRIKLTV